MFTMVFFYKLLSDYFCDFFINILKQFAWSLALET